MVPREQFEELCRALDQNGHFAKATMFRAHDAAQRNVIAEQVAEIDQLKAELGVALHAILEVRKALWLHRDIHDDLLEVFRSAQGKAK